ncbi:MAG: branched-chain amino acid ABC transporter permease [Deltaproteobacteria bacterium]|nr:branched-chain amino acid ABC transporter permease [Deltaproteobacteria bacterium]
MAVRLLQPVLIGAVALGFPLVVTGGYHLHLAIMALIFTVLVAGLNLLVGYMGLLSLGHAAFFGIGAYVSGLFYKKLGLSFWVGFPAAGVVAALAALVLGYIVLRVRGHRFVIISIAFQEIVRMVDSNWVELTNGYMGIAGIAAPRLLLGPLDIDFFPKQHFYYLALAVAALTVFVCQQLADSHIGRALIGIRESEALAGTVGISPFRYSMIAFTVGAFFGGLAGSLYAHFIGFISPDLFHFSVMIEMLVMLIMGGKGTTWGPVLGAIIFTMLPEYLRVAKDFRMIIFGGILVGAILYMPQGIIMPIVRIAERLPRLRRPAERPA